MKRLLLALCCLTALAANAAKADWYLYFYSGTYSLDGDAAQFETTDAADIVTINAVNVPASGINFCVHNSAWTSIYGWKSAAVNTKGTAVELATASQATGWLELPAGSYSVTFNATALTIQFDDPVSGGGEQETTPASFLLGGDLTMATYVEDWGAKFYYQNGTAGDLFDILQAYGVNLARLRLYNTPGTAVKDGSTTYRTPIMSAKYPSGYLYAGEQDILNLAKRAKNHNMKICLTFHLSDYWSNAATQMVPSKWNTATTTDGLADSVYNYVYRYMKRLEAQGTIPEYVSVGNESNYGILFQTVNGSSVSFGGKSDNVAQMVKLFNKAYDAVKAVSPSTQVIIHHSYGHDGKIAICRSFFKTLKDNGGKFDIVGGSYYPAWAAVQNSTDNTPSGMLAWAADMKKNIGKPVMIMETGYSWTQYRPSGRNGGDYEGQLGLNGSYNEATEDGQAAFMKELHDAIETDENILGYMYWDPIFVDQQVNGSWIKTCWAEKYNTEYSTWYEDGNVVSNTTLFDYTGKPLKALYSEINSRKPVSTAVEETTNEKMKKWENEKILQGGQFFIIREGKMYNALGAEVR